MNFQQNSKKVSGSSTTKNKLNIAKTNKNNMVFYKLHPYLKKEEDLSKTYLELLRIRSFKQNISYSYFK